MAHRVLSKLTLTRLWFGNGKAGGKRGGVETRGQRIKMASIHEHNSYTDLVDFQDVNAVLDVTVVTDKLRLRINSLLIFFQRNLVRVQRLGCNFSLEHWKSRSTSSHCHFRKFDFLPPRRRAHSRILYTNISFFGTNIKNERRNDLLMILFNNSARL